MRGQDLHVRKVPLAAGVEGMTLKQGDEQECVAMVRHKKMRLGLGPGMGDGEERTDWKDQTDENEDAMEAMNLGVHSFSPSG